MEDIFEFKERANRAFFEKHDLLCNDSCAYSWVDGAAWAKQESDAALAKANADKEQLYEALKLCNGKLNKAGVRCALAELALSEVKK
jgi:hypothetical protein